MFFLVLQICTLIVFLAFIYYDSKSVFTAFGHLVIKGTFVFKKKIKIDVHQIATTIKT